MSNTVKEALNFGNPTDLPQLLGRMNIGSLLEKLVTPTVDANARTVTTHVQNILGKLGLENRTQAALYAVEQGLAKKPGK